MPTDLPARPWWRSLVPLVVVVALLGVGELVCRALIHPTRLEKILAILERDPDLIWRLRPHLDTVFENHIVRTGSQNLRGSTFEVPKPAGVWRAITLGASPTFGWGVEEEDCYAPVAQHELAARGISAEVINGGTPGYTTWQGLRRLKRDVLAWSPNAITIAYDLNDLDRFRFFNNDGRVDEAETSDSSARVSIQNALNRSASYRLFRRALLSAASREGAFDPQAMPRRVPLDHYRNNLKAIATVGKENHIAVIFLKMPINLPFHRLTVIDADAAHEAFSRAEDAASRGDWDAALREYRESQRLDPSVVETYKGLLKVERRLDLPEAAKTEDLIPFVAAFRDRADLDYNRAVEEVAHQVGCPLIDVVKAFDEDGRGDGLWNSVEDPFHPNAAGHQIIGKLVADQLEIVYRETRSNP